MQQSHETWLGLPSFLHKRHDPEESSQVPNVKESVFLQIHLDYIFNEFLLYRILSKRLNTWSPDLVKVSHQVLSEILLLVDSRIRVMSLTPDLSWVVRIFLPRSILPLLTRRH